MSSPVLALFDFCQTLVGAHSVTEFLTYVHSRRPTLPGKLRESIRKPLARLGWLRGPAHKRFQLLHLRGLTPVELEKLSRDFVRDVLIPRGIPETLSKLEWHRAQGHRVVIVSGGLACYVSVFAREHGVSDVVATELEVRDGRATGRIRGSDCMGEAKVRRLGSAIDLSVFDLASSFAYSDDASDVPLLSLAGHRVVVHEGAPPDWATSGKYSLLARSPRA